MSVLIRNMEMPKSCYECKLDLRTDVCLAFCEWNAEHPYSIRATDRLPDCPLVELPEKHGRLIDVDALVTADICHDWNGCVLSDDYSEECTRKAPTVIKAEDE